MNFSIVLKSIVSFLWIAVIGLIILSVIKDSRGNKVGKLSTVILITVISAVILTTISAGLIFIKPEERGVVISAIAPKGYRETPLQPGLNWVIPFFENVEIYPISKQTYTMSKTPLEGQVQGDDSVTARTSDGQEIFIDASVIYAINPQSVILVHIAWQDRYPDDLVRPLTRGIIRDAVSQFNVEEVYSKKRDELRSDIEQTLNKKFTDNGLVMYDFILRNITFSPEYAASVEQKQIAEQQAQEAKLIVEKKKQEAEQARQIAKGKADAVVIESQGNAQARLIEAKAEAEALDLLAQSLNNKPDLLTYTYINKLSPGIQVMLVPNDTPYLLPLPQLGPPYSSSTPTPTPTPTLIPSPTPTSTP